MVENDFNPKHPVELAEASHEGRLLGYKVLRGTIRPVDLLGVTKKPDWKPQQAESIRIKTEENDG